MPSADFALSNSPSAIYNPPRLLCASGRSALLSCTQRYIPLSLSPVWFAAAAANRPGGISCQHSCGLDTYRNAPDHSTSGIRIEHEAARGIPSRMLTVATTYTRHSHLPDRGTENIHRRSIQVWPDVCQRRCAGNVRCLSCHESTLPGPSLHPDYLAGPLCRVSA